MMMQMNNIASNDQGNDRKKRKKQETYGVKKPANAYITFVLDNVHKMD
jgi:hypothetical protein